jgi:hypothetical protein
MSIFTIGKIEITRFVITTGGKKGLWTRALVHKANVCDEDPNYYHQVSNTSFIAINPQGSWVNWDDLPTGSAWIVCTKLMGSKIVNCSPELIDNFVFADPKAEKQFLHLLKTTDVSGE